jgi:putative ABC transport system permease protein
MRRIPGVKPLPHAGTTRHSIARDVDDELRFHLQMRIEDLMRDGHSRDDAEQIARREYGDMNQARSELTSIDRRAARHGAWRDWFESLGQDVRFGARALRSRPGFTLTILLTLALGIGANAAIFSVVDAVLLRPLPFAQPSSLVHLWETFQSKVDNRSEASFPDYLDWRARNKAFSDIAGYQGSGFLLGGAQPMTVGAGKTTANFFDVLGVRAMIGRTFAPGEDAPGAARVAVLTYGFWQQQFAGDPAVVGRQITLDGAQATVIGVLPESFIFGRLGGAQVWAPIDRSAQYRTNRGNHWLNVVARYKPGVTQATAAQDMSGIMHDLAREYPATNTGRDGSVVPLQDEFVGTVRPVLRLLYGAVIVVLLIACVNVANLLLIRGADRQQEIAVRVALGAGTGRLVRQLLTESLLLAVGGGLLGLGVAKLGVHSLVGLMPAQQIRGIPALSTARLDPGVVAYALLVSLCAGLGFGIIPALRLARPAIHESIKNAARGTIGGASRLRDGLVVGEIALTVILMSGALLFGRSLIRLLAVDPGFRQEHVITTTIVLPGVTYQKSQQQIGFYQRLADRLHELPGVEAVGFVSRMPLDFGNSLGFTIVGQPAPDPGREPTASYRQASTEYFHAMRIPLVRGRVFGSADGAQAPSTAVVNRTLADAYFSGHEAVGQRVVISGDTMTIVGVVGDVPIGNLGDKIPPTLYLSFDKFPQTAMAVAVRTNADLDQGARAIRQTLSSLDPSAAVTRVTTMETLISESPSVFLRRFPLALVGGFAVTALLLAIVGIYGVVSYSVAQRSREMGIRMALGAQPGSLIALVVRHGGSMAIVGIVVGVTGALMLGRFAEKMLFGIRPNDPLTYVTVTAVLAAVALVATILPARRATRVDPALALRSE